MLLDIVVIVLRETLEASILVGVLLCVSRMTNIGFSWLWLALAAGATGAFLYAINLGSISEMFDYVGQEIISAALQIVIYGLLVVIIAIQFSEHNDAAHWLKGLMIAAVAVAVTREGGELFVFYSGFLQSGDSLLTAATSGFIGLAVGMSAGAIVYYSLVSQNPVLSRTFYTLVLALVAGGMILQSTGLLIQADWLTASQPLWNSNTLLPEASVLGQVVYAVFGYEATPSKQEVVVYLASIVFIIAVITIMKMRARHQHVAQL
jgi:high-affinity iron transporter